MSVGQVTTINSYVFGAISIILNTLLILVIYNRSLKIIGAYKYMMITATIFDICLSIIYFIASPTFAAVSQMSSMLIVKGGIKLPVGCAIAILFIFIWLLCQTIVTPPCLFVFRYLQICRTSFLINNVRSLRYFLIIPIFAASSSCALICFAAWPTENQIAVFEPIAFDMNAHGKYVFLVASLNDGDGTLFENAQTIVMWIGIVYLIIIMISSLLTMIYCTKRMMEAARQSFNEKTRLVQQQFYRMLIAQFMVPFLFIHIPFYVCIVAPIFSLSTGNVADYLPFLFAWSPAINPLIIFYFVPDYRKYLLGKLRRRKVELSSSHSMFVTTVRRK